MANMETMGADVAHLRFEGKSWNLRLPPALVGDSSGNNIMLSKLHVILGFLSFLLGNVHPPDE